MLLSQREWILQGRPERSETDLVGHTNSIAIVRWDPTTADRLASVSIDNTVKWVLCGRSTTMTSSSNNVLLRSFLTNARRSSNDEAIWVFDLQTICRLWDARSSRCMGTVKVTARPLFIAWKADGSELLCLDQSDIISVISAKTFKVVRKHKYGSQVRFACILLLELQVGIDMR
jgi:hypothetical protein